MKQLIWLLALMILQVSAWSQETLITDSATIPPFEGVIGYRIRYEVKVNPASKSYIWTGYVPQAKKLTEKLVLAGRPCTAWTLTRDKQVEKIWVNDSIYFGGTLVDTLKKEQPSFLAAGIRQIPLQAKRVHAEEI